LDFLGPGLALTVALLLLLLRQLVEHLWWRRRHVARGTRRLELCDAPRLALPLLAKVEGGRVLLAVPVRWEAPGELLEHWSPRGPVEGPLAPPAPGDRVAAPLKALLLANITVAFMLMHVALTIPLMSLITEFVHI
jgi:hypothetical protein